MVSIITVNYNGWKDTYDLINSLKEHETYPYEFIVVDNASSEDEAEQILSIYPDVKVVRSDANLGFAGGNNLGYAYSKGEYLFFLNNDMLIEEPILEKMIVCLEKREVGGVSPTVRYLKDKGSVQYFGCKRLNPLTLKFRTEAFDRTCPERFLIPGETDVMYGGAMMVRRDVIEKVGRMTEVYFLFSEEYDWSYRIADAGYKLWYAADTVIYHKGGATIGYGTPLRAYYMSRARLLFARRNNSGWKRTLSCAYLSVISMAKNVACALFEGNFKRAKAVVWGTWRGLMDEKE